jgi:hypothetical protein
MLLILRLVEKSKSMSNEPSTARKSQDASQAIDGEKSMKKKSIYKKVAFFLLKYNLATVSCSAQWEKTKRVF